MRISTEPSGIQMLRASIEALRSNKRLLPALERLDTDGVHLAYRNLLCKLANELGNEEPNIPPQEVKFI